MMTEHDELQRILEEAGEPEEGESKHGTPWINNPRDIRQWIVEGNDSFQATGETIKELLPGMYKLSVDDRGTIHFRRTPVLTDKIINLHDPRSDEIIAGIRKFWKSADRFTEIGMLYKRGVLLWGPAGSGKTVTVTILTRELVEAGGLVIFCEHPGIAIRGLEVLRKAESERRLIVVLEDIEELIHKYGEHELLALLDGEHQVANVVHIATTNYPERLGARIINRPSRFDQVMKIGMPNYEARAAYFYATVPDKDRLEENIDKWIADTDGMSIAHLRELVVSLFCLDESYENTIVRLKKMSLKKASSSEFDNQVGMAPTPAIRTASFVNGRIRVKPTIDNPAGL